MTDTLGPGTIRTLVLRRPFLILEAIRLFFATRKRTRLVPSSSYLDWRSHTAFGAVTATPADEFLDFVRWRGQMRRLRKAR